MAKRKEADAVDDAVEAPAPENRVASYSYDAAGNPEPGQVLIEGDPES